MEQCDGYSFVKLMKSCVDRRCKSKRTGTHVMAYANCSFLPRLGSQPNRSPKFCLSEEQQTLKLCYEFMTPSTAFLPHHLRRKMLVAVAVQ
nr:hypothetical protein Iba_chr02aCG6710 [Ipomoea batatas]